MSSFCICKSKSCSHFFSNNTCEFSIVLTGIYGRFPISSNTRIIRTPLTVLKSSPENCSFSPNSHVFLSNSFLNSSNTWSAIHKLYMYSSLMNITYLEFPCAIRWKKMINMNCYTKKQQLNLTKKAVTNKSTSPLMWLIKIATEALGSTHSRRQLKIYVICKADSEEPKNKSEFIFLKRRLIWVFCNGYKVQFSSLLFCRWSLNTETKKGFLPIVKKKK